MKSLTSYQKLELADLVVLVNNERPGHRNTKIAFLLGLMPERTINSLVKKGWAYYAPHSVSRIPSAWGQRQSHWFLTDEAIEKLGVKID